MPAEIQVDAPLIIASLLILAILGSSGILWIRQILGPRNLSKVNVGVPAWPIGWVNFGIFICALIICVYVTQITFGLLFFEPGAENDFEMTPWIAVIAVLLLQLPMLAVFYGLRRLYPSHYGGQLNNTELSALEAFNKALPLFLMFLPVVWIASLFWTNILTALEDIGLIEAFEPQALITLLQGGGDPLAILFLVVMAVVLAPIVEEIIFRACVYRFFRSQTTVVIAQILSGGLFSVIHWNLLSFIPLLFVGIFLARVYEKSGNIMVAIWFHAFFNAFSLLMLFLTSMSGVILE